MVKVKSKSVLLILLASLLISPFLILPLIFSLSDKLSETEKICDANILVVEGWLPRYLLSQVRDEFQKNRYDYVVTTGMITSKKYINIAENGYLIFYTGKKLPSGSQPGKHQVTVRAYSELGGKHSAHFNLWVNDKCLASFSASKRSRKYSATWEGRLSDIDSVMVQFTNDGVGEYGDRNLYVCSVLFDNSREIPFLFNSVYDVGRIDSERRARNNINSNAEKMAKDLILSGIDSNRVFTVPAGKVRLNRTLSSALAFRDWLKTSDIKITGINIISSGTHSLRTWLTFRKVLDGSIKTGIISLPDYANQYSRKRKVLKTLWETVSLIYYWIILIPY